MQKKGKTSKDDGPLQWMQRWFAAWMDSNEDLRATDLAEALQGYGLPAVGHEDDPYLWIWRGVPSKGMARKRALKLLVQAIKIILDLRPPESLWVWQFNNRTQYNVFSLCSLLKSHDLLVPLQQLKEHIQSIQPSSSGQEVIGMFQEALKASFLDSVLREKGRAYHDECANYLASTVGDFDANAALKIARLFVSPVAVS